VSDTRFPHRAALVRRGQRALLQLLLDRGTNRDNALSWLNSNPELPDPDNEAPEEGEIF
jgi:hypothetical protein